MVRTSRSRRWLAAFSIVPLALASCGGRVPVPAELEKGATVIPITERKSVIMPFTDDDPFVMGPYKTFGTDRRGRDGTHWNFFGIIPGKGFSKQTTVEHLSFVFAGPGGQVKSGCTAALVEYEVRGHLDMSHWEDKVNCKCEGAGLNAEVRMTADDGKWTSEALLHGYPLPLKIITVDSNGVPLPKTVGYQVGGSEAIGLLEMRPPGTVWLANKLDPISHAELACVFTALLLVKLPARHYKK